MSNVIADPTTKTRAGDVRGFVEEGNAVFLGIPYAEPPLGENRFAAPVAVKGWKGTRDVLKYGPTAPQNDPGITIIPEPVEPGEDFLNLNVFTPDLGDAKLPVYVWIHGGGFVSGCNRSPWYRGNRFARDGVVSVTIGYRLGIEGFLRIDDAPANRAVLDWVCALEWVQDNIASFGGDPSNVTIGGQSAGSAACLILMTNPRAKGLFHRVTGMSGTSDTRMPPENAAQMSAQIAMHLGVKGNRAELSRFSPDELIAAHAAVATNPFTADALTSGFDPGAPGLRPFVDGDVIQSHPFRDIREGVGRDVDLVAGSTAEEVTGLLRLQRGAMDDEAAKKALAKMGIAGEKLESYMKHVGTTDAVEALGQAATDRAFRTPLAQLLEDRAGHEGKTFGYEFRWRSPAFDGLAGSAHCLDVPFVWDNLDAGRSNMDLLGAEPPQELADEMHRAWVGFITDGDAGWPAYDGDRRAVKRFDTPSAVADDALAYERELFAKRLG
ncbi:MAG: carboxylesterase family protein [Actinomycetota bacterium]